MGKTTGGSLLIGREPVSADGTADPPSTPPLYCPAFVADVSSASSSGSRSGSNGCTRGASMLEGGGSYDSCRPAPNCGSTVTFTLP